MRAQRRLAIEARVRRERVDVEGEILTLLERGWWSASAVAEQLGCTVPHARRTLARMADEGALRVRLGAVQRGPGGRRRLFAAVGRRGP